MLPAHLAENIRKQVLFYLQSTFDFRDKNVEKAFERFLTDPDAGLFKGPWVQLQRPYLPAEDALSPDGSFADAPPLEVSWDIDNGLHPVTKTFYPPFTKVDRKADFAWAWKVFEERHGKDGS